MDKRHGGPYDRGAADSYYRRKFDPHYFKGGTYTSERVNMSDLTAEERAEYAQGFADNEERKDFKVW